MRDIKRIVELPIGFTLTPGAQHARLMQALARSKGEMIHVGEGGPEPFWAAARFAAISPKRE